MSSAFKTSLSANNVLDFGADPTGTVNSTAAIQAAIDDAIGNADVSGVFVPPGTYLIGDPTNSDPLTSHLRLNNADDIMFFGAGPSSILREVGGNYGGNNGYAIIRVDGALTQSVILRDFVVDGNRANVTNIGVDYHGVFVKAGLGVILERVRAHDCPGDEGAGIGVGGFDAGEFVVLSPVRYCFAYDNDNAGIIMRATVSASQIEACAAFDNDLATSAGQIVIESVLAGGAIPNQIQLTTCVADGGLTGQALQIVAKGAADDPERLTVSDNLFIGKVQIDDATDLIFGDNICVAADFATSEGTITVGENVDDLTIHSCIILAQLSLAANAVAIYLTGAGGTGRGNILVRDSLLTAEGPAADCIVAVSGNQAGFVTAIDSNVMIRGASGRRGVTIQADSATFDFGDVQVRGNAFMGGWSQAVSLRPNLGSIDNVLIATNLFDVTGDCVDFDDSLSTFAGIPVVADNYTTGLELRLFDATKLASMPMGVIIVGGNPRTGATAHNTAGAVKFLGEGDPNLVVTGNRGDTFQRIDGAPTLWACTADGTTTWSSA